MPPKPAPRRGRRGAGQRAQVDAAEVGEPEGAHPHDRARQLDQPVGPAERRNRAARRRRTAGCGPGSTLDEYVKPASATHVDGPARLRDEREHAGRGTRRPAPPVTSSSSALPRVDVVARAASGSSSVSGTWRQPWSPISWPARRRPRARDRVRCSAISPTTKNVPRTPRCVEEVEHAAGEVRIPLAARCASAGRWSSRSRVKVTAPDS